MKKLSWRIVDRLLHLSFILFILVSNGKAWGQSDTTQTALLERIPTEILPSDSAAQATKNEEIQWLEKGDTIQAFTHYVQWMAYHIDRGNQLKFGQEFDPYLAYAQNHEELGNHYLYKYLYGLHLSYTGNINTSVRQMLDAEKNISEKHEEFLENLYFEVTSNFLKLTDFEGATEYALKNLELNEIREDKSGELSARMLIATCFSKQNRFEEASRQRSRAAELSRETGEYGQLIFIYANNAIDERKQENFDLSFDFYEDASATIDTNTTFDANTQLYFRTFLKSNKLTLFNDAGMTDSVILLGPEIIDSLRKYQLSQSIIDAKIQMGRAYMLEDKIHMARDYLEEARDELEGSGLEDFDIAVNRYLAQIYQQIGDYPKATEALSRQILVQQQVDSVNNRQLINSLQMRYESDRQQQLIEETELQVQEEINQRKANVRIYTASLIGLSLIAFSFFQWRNRRQLKREKEIEINYHQKLIQYQEDENTRISKELHDGIGQSLMLIKNKVRLNNDEQTAQMVGDTLSEVRNISRALHPFTLQKLGLTAAIEKLINDFDENSDILVDAQIEYIDGHFSEKSALNIFRIIQEILSNIMKHADAKSVDFTVRAYADHAKLDVRDNGLGFDVSENFNTVSSLGLKTLKERTRFLEGQLNINSEKGSGTQITLKIPFDV